MRCLNGGWSYSWQGHVADDYTQAYHTIYEALCEKYGKENIIYEPGVTYAPYKNDNWWEENKPEIEKPIAAAAQADIIIACIGENSYCETPGNLTDLTLSENQRNLVKALAATGKPIVLVLNQGRPRIINDIEPLAKAVVNIMLPSNYGGDALANLLAGDANFSGKMPFTYPRLINALATYDYKPCENMGQMGGNYNYDSVMDIQWPFGFGLSYTNYKYNNLKVNKPTFNADDELIFTIDVTNTGKVAGKESVLLFSKDLVASSTPDNIRLRNFEKISLKPGETKTVTLKLKGSDLAFVGYDGKWRLEKEISRSNAVTNGLILYAIRRKCGILRIKILFANKLLLIYKKSLFSITYHQRQSNTLFIEVSGGDRLFFNLSPHLSPITAKALLSSHFCKDNLNNYDLESHFFFSSQEPSPI